MTLTAYSGVTCPYQGLVRNATLGSPAAIYGDSASSASSASLSTNPGTQTFETMQIGDRFVVAIAIASSTVSVTGVQIADVTSTPLTGQTFTRSTRVQQGAIALEIWISNALPATNANNDWTTTVTLSAAARVNYSITQWRGVSGFAGNITGGSSSAGTTWSLTGAASSQSNCAQLNFVANTNSVVPTVTSGLPVGLLNHQINLPATSLSLLGGWDNFEANGFTPIWSGTQASSIWVTSGITLVGNKVSLDDLTLQFRDDGTGVLLNNPANTLPIYDVSAITGLADINIANSSSAIDGADGSYVDAKFTSGKTIVIDGTITAAVPVDEVAVLDSLRNSVRGTQLDGGIPLFYKLPSYAPRYIMCKPTACKVGFDRGRSLGQVPFEVQALSSDSRSYGLASWGPISDSGQIKRFTTSGNAVNYPRIYFNVYTADFGSGHYFYFQNYTWNSYAGYEGIIQITAANSTVLPVGSYCLDLAARTLTLLGATTYTTTAADVDYSSAIVQRGWWGLVPNTTNITKMSRGSGGSNEWYYVVRNDAWL